MLTVEAIEENLFLQIQEDDISLTMQIADSAPSGVVVSGAPGNVLQTNPDGLYVGAVQYVQTIDDLAQIKPNILKDGQAAQVVSTGRAGLFRWQSGDLSAECAADPLRGIYAPADGDDGSGGAWVRVCEQRGAFRPEWFGGGADVGKTTAAIQSIIDLAGTELMATIMLAGDIYETDTINVAPGQKVAFISRSSGTLRLKSGSSSGRLIQQTDDSDVVDTFILDGVVVDGNHPGQSAVAPTIEVFVREARVRNCTFTRVQMQGLRFPHVADLADIRANVFKEGREHTGVAGEVTSYLSVRTSETLAASEKQIVNVSGNLFIGIEPSQPGRGVGGVIASGATGIGEFDGHKLIVDGNTFVGIGVDALDNKISSVALYRRAGQSIVTNNRILHSRNWAIEAQGSPHVIIQGNVMCDQSAETSEGAIKISGRDGDKWSDKCVVQGNIVRNWNGPAILSQSSDGEQPVADLLIQQNQFVNVLQFVHLRNFGGAIKVQGNLFDTSTATATGSDKRPVYVATDRTGTPRTAEVDVSGNTIKNTQTGAIHVEGVDGEVAVTGNIMRTMSGGPAVTALSSQGVVSITGNLVDDVGDDRFVSTANITGLVRVDGNSFSSSTRTNSRVVQATSTTGDVIVTGNAIMDCEASSEIMNFDTTSGRLLLTNNVVPAGSGFRFFGTPDRTEANNVT